jgi:hypothetical protein
MSIATSLASLAREAGVTVEDILREAGVDREGAIRNLASGLGVDLNELADSPELPGALIEVTDEDVQKVREGLTVLSRIFQ